jgi:hypothetical protein
VNGFMDHLYTRLETTINYIAIANLHTLKLPQYPLSIFPPCCVFISRSLATTSNSGDSSASSAQVSSSQPPMQNCISTNSLPLSTKWARVRVRVRIPLRLASYRQSVRLGARPLETHDQIFFQLNSCGNSPYVTYTLTG